MNSMELQQEGKGYAVATVGDIADFSGKAFAKDLLNTTSMELSFGTLAAGEAVPFNHRHKQNEEVYVVLSGEGEFTLGADTVTVKSGSVVRVSPEVLRCTRNTGSAPLTYICIQAKAGSLEQYTMTDAIVE